MTRYPEPRRYSVADDMMRDDRRPQPTLPDPFHRREPNPLRGIVIGLALSTLFWALCVLLPLWLHYGPAGVGR